MKLDRVLGGVTALIVRTCDPDRIVLFGSCAKGLQNVDSDLDILVIGDFQGSTFLRGLDLRQQLTGYPIRIDLHLATPAEVDAESRTPFGFLTSVLASGEDLYLKSVATAHPQSSRSHHSSSLTCVGDHAKN
jgi:predicted nucleotidyltransferase